MQCPACTRQVAAWADFCPHCGAPQTVGATAAVPDPTPDPTPVIDTAPDAYAGESFSLLDEVFATTEDDRNGPFDVEPEALEVEPEPVDVALPAEPEQRAEPLPTTALPLDPRPVSSADLEPTPDGARPASSRWILTLAGGLVAVTLLVVLWSVLRVDGSTGSEAASGASGMSPSASGSTSPSASDPSGSPSATPSPLPAGAISCGTSQTAGGKDSSAVFTPDANTTCPFALAVATAYRTAAPNGGEAAITAHSPVTNLDYALTCTGALPTTCRADSGATVFLTRP